MKLKLLILVVFIFNLNNLFSQFSSKTEYNYLKLINYQQDKKLIKSSVINAEIVANNLLLQENKSVIPLFYNELSNSFYITNKYDKSLYYQILQRTLFGNDSITNNSKSRFYDCAFKMNLSKNEIDYFWNNTAKEKIPNSKNEQLLKSIKLGTKLFSKKLTSQILQLGNLLKKQDYKMPQWYNDWEYLTIIGIKEKHKNNFMDFNTKSDIFVRLNKKNRLKVYNKSINYYTKNHSFNQSNKLITAFKKEDLSFINKSGLIIKKITQLYHKII